MIKSERSNVRNRARSSRLPRKRRVRASYPAELVELALMLCSTMGKREAARYLGVALSSVYRWVRNQRATRTARRFVGADGKVVSPAELVVTLSAQCERVGLTLRPSTSRRGYEATFLPQKSVASFLSRRSLKSYQGKKEATRTGVPHDEVPLPEKMSWAKQVIDCDFASLVSCKKIADSLAMSRVQFIKTFAATFGVPPYRYLRRVRVEKAWEMLQRSDLDLVAVAAASGFGSLASMQRAFKRFAGGCPSKVVSVIAPLRNIESARSYDAQIIVNE